MLESNVIQYRGFHNIEENGKITGFQICIRSDYYRGVWLSQLRPGKVVVDGVTYPKECVIWEINGKDYTVDELAEAGSDFWRITDTAALKIPKEGGLEQGAHTVSVRHDHCLTEITALFCIAPASCRLHGGKAFRNNWGFQNRTFLRFRLLFYQDTGSDRSLHD